MSKRIIAILLVIPLLGGCFMNKPDYDEETTAQAKQAAEAYLKENRQDIESVEFEEVYRSPMGGMNVDGTVNKQFIFSLSVDEDKFTIQSGGYGEGFPKRKEDYDLETREQATKVVESYLKNNYQDIDSMEFETFKRLSDPVVMEVLVEVNTYGTSLFLDESELTVEDIDIRGSSEGLHPEYDPPQRKPECEAEDCDY